MGKSKFRRAHKAAKPQGRPRQRAPHYVPGWGGVFGRFAKMGMGAVSKGGIAYKALNLARKVANAVNVEYKRTSYQTAGAIDYSGGVNSMLTGIAQDLTDAGRVGDSIKLQNLMLRYYASRTTGDALLRVMVIWDPQNKITAVSDVLSTSGNAYGVISPKNYDKRFYGSVLYDRVLQLTSGNATIATEDVVIPIDKHTQFAGGTTTINTGDLKLIMLSNLTAANLPTVQLFATVTYTDN